MPRNLLTRRNCLHVSAKAALLSRGTLSRILAQSSSGSFCRSVCSPLLLFVACPELSVATRTARGVDLESLPSLISVLSWRGRTLQRDPRPLSPSLSSCASFRFATSGSSLSSSSSFSTSSAMRSSARSSQLSSAGLGMSLSSCASFRFATSGSSSSSSSLPRPR